MATLYIVATPIGNLEDISLRAISVLSNVTVVFAEDTRVTRILFDRYNIKTKLISYHQHSGSAKVSRVIEALRKGESVAVVSDAGTPGISDPGNLLISEVVKALPETKIVPIPGANAVIATLSVSGFPSDHFVFLGFPPHKKGRQTFFRRIAEIENVIVFYESKYRIGKCLDELERVAKIGERQIMVARELTKQFETIYRGTVESVKTQVMSREPLGEFVVVIGPER